MGNLASITGKVIQIFYVGYDDVTIPTTPLLIRTSFTLRHLYGCPTKDATQTETIAKYPQ